MPAFSARKLEELEGAINKLYARTIECINQPKISKTEIYDALVKPEHRELLLKTEDLVGTIQTHSYLSFDVKLGPQRITLNAAFPTGPLEHIMPDYYKKGMHGEANPETVEKITNWVKMRSSIGWDFCKAHKVLNELNEHMASPKQVKFFFDGIVGLCEMAEMKDLADKLRDPFVPASFPSIPVELRQACKDATQAIARGLLVDPEQKTKRHSVVFSIERGAAGSARFPWHKVGSQSIW